MMHEFEMRAANRQDGVEIEKRVFVWEPDSVWILRRRVMVWHQ